MLRRTKMDVTIIGTGNMARGIATRLLDGGHEITLLGTEAGKAEGLASEFGGSVGAGVVGDEISGDMVVLAVPYDAAATVLRGYGEALSGKTVVDISNPVDWHTFDDLVTPLDSSAAEELQKAAPDGVSLVKAWNTTFAGTLVAGEVAGQALDVYVAGDDAGAKESVIGLVESGGSRAIDAGPLRRARELERLGFLGMTLQQPTGLNFQSAWKLVS
jgi:predicted dinucleotide-binding enzyme